MTIYEQLEHRVRIWVRAFISIFDALVVIISFTALNPYNHMRFFCWELKRGAALRNKYKNKLHHETCNPVSDHP